MEKKFDAGDMLNDCDAGILMEKLSRALAYTALAVCGTGRKGEIVLKLSMSQIGGSSQLALAHTIKRSTPTRRGRETEEDATQTSMYVGPKGELTLMPLRQTDLFKTSETTNEAG